MSLKEVDANLKSVGSHFQATEAPITSHLSIFCLAFCTNKLQLLGLGRNAKGFYVTSHIIGRFMQKRWSTIPVMWYIKYHSCKSTLDTHSIKSQHLRLLQQNRASFGLLSKQITASLINLHLPWLTLGFCVDCDCWPVGRATNAHNKQVRHCY